VVLVRASDAAAAAGAVQRALNGGERIERSTSRSGSAWSYTRGEADLYMGDYYAPAVNHCARLRAVACGGQVLVSAVTTDVLV
jgi:class 3 adenylate cyclase